MQQQRYAYRRDPAQVVHSSTFQPQQNAGHGHGIQLVPSTNHTIQSHSSATAAVEHTPVVLPPAQTSSTPAAPAQSGFSLANLMKYANPDEIKGMVDRFGGLDGILATVTKVQKVVSTVGQIAPMVKVFTGLGKKSSSNEGSETSLPARRPSSSGKARSGRRSPHPKARRIQTIQRPPSAQRVSKKSTPLTKRPPSR